MSPNVAPIIITTALAVCVSGHFDLLRFDEFEFKFNHLSTHQRHQRHHRHHRSLILDDTDDAFRCTEVPIISKQLCFRWDTNNGFEYGYDNQGTLDDIISMNDDSKWHEINTFNNNEYTKQCRYSTGMQECIRYSPSNAVTLKLRIGTNREPRDTFNFDNILPANMYDMNDNHGLDIDQFIFGNDAFNSHPYMPMFTNTHDYAHSFGYGDALGFDQWGADIMNWKGFTCNVCDDMNIMDDDFKFESYGDYTYLFNEHELSVSNESECTSMITGLAHKICATKDNKIYFKKQHDEIVSDVINEKLQNEFDGVVLNFNNDSIWTDITTLHDQMQSTRKCKTFQNAQVCVTDKQNGYLQVNIKVGTHKLHRITDELQPLDDLFSNWNSDEYVYESGSDNYDDHENYNEYNVITDFDISNGEDIIYDEYDNDNDADKVPVSDDVSDDNESIMVYEKEIYYFVIINICAMIFCIAMCCVIFLYWRRNRNGGKTDLEDGIMKTECEITTTTQGEVSP